MRYLAPIWGLAGVLLLLGFAIYRLAPRAMEAMQSGLSVFQWLVLAGFAVFMAYSEGYRGFQKKFSPRTAARTRYLSQHPTLLQTVLAPFFCMGYFHAKPKTRITAIVLTAAIVILVLLVSLCPQPWRGIVDLGVVLGLAWGVISLLAFTWQAFTSESFAHSPETPDS